MFVMSISIPLFCWLTLYYIGYDLYYIVYSKDHLTSNAVLYTSLDPRPHYHQGKEACEGGYAYTCLRGGWTRVILSHE